MVCLYSEKALKHDIGALTVLKTKMALFEWRFNAQADHCVLVYNVYYDDNVICAEVFEFILVCQRKQNKLFILFNRKMSSSFEHSTTAHCRIWFQLLDFANGQPHEEVSATAVSLSVASDVDQLGDAAKAKYIDRVLKKSRLAASESTNLVLH